MCFHVDLAHTIGAEPIDKICMVQLLARIISLRRVLEANPGRLHGSADTLPLRHSANIMFEPLFWQERAAGL